MAYDTAWGETLLFGGADASGYLDDTWAWTGLAWSPRSPAGGVRPVARDGHMMAYDAARQEVVLFGGYSSGVGVRGDTWVWDRSTLTWTQKCSACGPAARDVASMAYDPVRQEVVLFGGEGPLNAWRNDTWVWDGSSWTQRAADGCAGCPPGRIYAQMTYEPVRRELLLFGGRDQSGEYLADTWTWDGTAWRQRDEARFPPGREGGQMEFDLAHGGAVLFGGFDGAALADTWTFGPRAEAPRLPTEWPSSDCPASGNVLRGYVGDLFVLLRTAPEPTGATAVCIAADDGDAHLGGKLVVNGAPGTPVVVDDEATACSDDTSNERLQSGLLLGQPYALDLTPLPGGAAADAVWVCVQAAGVGARLVVTTAGATDGSRFEPDTPVPPAGGYAEEPWPVAAQPSSACYDSPGGVKRRHVNLRVGPSDRVALASRTVTSLGSSEAKLCFRGQAGALSQGGVLDVEAAVVVPTVNVHDDLGPCTFAVLTRDEHPRFGLYTSPVEPDPDSLPSSACVQVAGTTVRVTTQYAASAGAFFEEDAA